MTRNAAIILRSFLYGFTGAGLFRKLQYPGAPNEFVDSRTLEEIRRTGEIDRNIQKYRGRKLDALQREAQPLAAEEANAQRARR